MAAECIKTIKLRMRAQCGHVLAAGSGPEQPGILHRVRSGFRSHGTPGEGTVGHQGSGDVHHESDDICDVEAPHAGRAKKGSRPDGATREFSRKARRSS